MYGILFLIKFLYFQMESSIDQGSSPQESSKDGSYLVSSNDLEKYRIRLIYGDKDDSTWLVVDNQYIFHRNDISLNGEQVYWECARRKQSR